MKNENVGISRNVVLYSTWKVISTRMQKIQKFGHCGVEKRVSGLLHIYIHRLSAHETTLILSRRAGRKGKCPCLPCRW